MKTFGLERLTDMVRGIAHQPPEPTTRVMGK